ncbi:MAG: tRNA dihydrouridine(20/20a) synthase DusA [Calditrichaeota bacterium]|nr:MAG: tRNA dihydrouridine(20/20a) synthase DusA [Calditrichota bacterium]
MTKKDLQNDTAYPVSIAPMMDHTDRHFRYFLRQITRRTLLYTEMKTSGAVLFGDREKILGFSEVEKPLVLQIGGDNPEELAEASRIAEDMGYDGVNLNVGCPSDRVQQGRFGACLMAHPELVARAVEAMLKAVSIPVTVKHRIGIDGMEEYHHLHRFVKIVSEAGCRHFIVHARIAILKGLNPRENRTIPPLRYEDVYRLKEDFPHLIIEVNGGIRSLEEVHTHLQHVDGVMIGRAAYENPYLFSEVDRMFYGSSHLPPSRREIIEAMIPYIEKWLAKGIYPNRITRHMLGLFAHRPGAKAWKRYLSEHAHKPGTTADILLKAMDFVPNAILDERGLITTPQSHVRKENIESHSP